MLELGSYKRHSQKCVIAQTSLNQSALDFEGNKARIIASIKKAKNLGCKFRACQEAEIPGYSCEDHFKELDTFTHSWEVVAELLKDKSLTTGIIVETTMPIIHRGSAYNCKLVLLNGKIAGIRPKVFMADGKNYRESRYFSCYQPKQNRELEVYYLPKVVQEVTGQESVPFGLFNLRTKDGVYIGLEICEEVWRLDTVTRKFILDCDLIFCANASHFEAEKLRKRINCVQSRTSSFNGAYFYSNAIGCDGNRLVFDGSNFVICNGEVVFLAESCPLAEVVVEPIVVDLGSIRRKRLGNVNDLREAAMVEKAVPLIELDIVLGGVGPGGGNGALGDGLEVEEVLDLRRDVSKKGRVVDFECKEEQVLRCMTAYLWDYLRKSGASGLFLPLSGGADSGSTALAVFYLAVRIIKVLNSEKDIVRFGADLGDKNAEEDPLTKLYRKERRQEVLDGLRKIVKDENFDPKNPQEIVKRILFTRYLGTDNSSEDTRKRAADLAAFIGSDHQEISITKIFEKFKEMIKETLSFDPKFKIEGGGWQEDIALQNIQARIRMVISYMFAQLIPSRLKINGFLIVLASGNIDESLVGYWTKYDCGSGDLNLIGSLNKIELRELLSFLAKKFPETGSIGAILEAKPSAELTPLAVGVGAKGGVEGDGGRVEVKEQTDEEDIGLSYKEIRLFNHLRNVELCGMVSMFDYMCEEFPDVSPLEIKQKVDIFYGRYMRNRHKAVVITPSVHLSEYSCDDNRFDLRPFLYDGGKLDYQSGVIKKKIMAMFRG